MADKYTSKPQPTLKGFLAWAFDQYVSADDQEPGPVAAQMLESWLRLNRKMLAEEYGVTRERYRRETGGNVAEFPRKTAGGSQRDGKPS